MSFLGDLGKVFQGAVAQVNPWDNGATFDSVVNVKKKKQQQTVSAPTAKTAVSPVSISTPKAPTPTLSMTPVKTSTPSLTTPPASPIAPQKVNTPTTPILKPAAPSAKLTSQPVVQPNPIAQQPMVKPSTLVADVNKMKATVNPNINNGPTLVPQKFQPIVTPPKVPTLTVAPKQPQQDLSIEAVRQKVASENTVADTRPFPMRVHGDYFDKANEALRVGSVNEENAKVAGVLKNELARGAKANPQTIATLTNQIGIIRDTHTKERAENIGSGVYGAFDGESIDSLEKKSRETSSLEQRAIFDRVDSAINKLKHEAYTDKDVRQLYLLQQAREAMQYNQKDDLRSAPVALIKALITDPLTAAGEGVASAITAADGSREARAQTIDKEADLAYKNMLLSRKQNDGNAGYWTNEWDTKTREAQRLRELQVNESDPILNAGRVTNAASMPVLYAAGAGTSGTAAVAGANAEEKIAATAFGRAMQRSEQAIKPVSEALNKPFESMAGGKLVQSPTAVVEDALLNKGVSANAARITGAIAENTAVGTPTALAQVAADKGSSATPEDYALALAQNAGMSAAIPAAAAVLGHSLRPGTPYKQTDRVPASPIENAAAVDNGIITPVTKHLSVEERVKTALHSKVEETVATPEAQPTPDVLPLDTPPAVATPRDALLADAERRGIDSQVTSRMDNPELPANDNRPVVYEGRIYDNRALAEAEIENAALDSVGSLPEHLQEAAFDAKIADEYTKVSNLDNQVPDTINKRLRDKIKEIIVQDNPELMYGANDSLPQVGEGYADGVPSIHADDLKHYFGAAAEDFPKKYTRTSGARDIDLLAQRAGFDDVDKFMEAVQYRVDNSKRLRDMARDISEQRRDPATRARAIEELRPAFESELRSSVGDKAFEHLKQAHGEVQLITEMSKSLKNVDFGDGSTIPVRNIRVKGRLANEPGTNINVRQRRTKIDVQAPDQGKNPRIQEYVAVQNVGADGNPTATELIPLDGTKHKLDNGVVVDKQGKSVGSYVGIDDKGNQYAYVGGKAMNINKVLGDVDAWGNVNSAFKDMDRLIEENAPDAQTARKVQTFTTHFKDQQESAMKTDLLMRRRKLQEVESSVTSDKGAKSAFNTWVKNNKDVIAKEQADAKAKTGDKAKASQHPQSKKFEESVSQDLFRAMEGHFSGNFDELRAKYGDVFVDGTFTDTVKWGREEFDGILRRTNAILKQYGYPEIPRIKNYITHFQENPTAWEKIGIGIQDLSPFGKSIDSDINPGKTRGAIPTEIVGNTADTGARRKWNPFAQHREGKQTTQDFFGAVDQYLEPMLFNQYMTPAASRVRVIERSFRTFEKAREIKMNELLEYMDKSDASDALGMNRPKHKNYKGERTSPFVVALQEYGNALAGKSNAIDRVITDKMGDHGKKLIDVSTKMQGIAGANLIPGSTTSALAQVLSVPQTIAKNGAKNTMAAISDMFKYHKSAGSKLRDPMIDSAFMRDRYTDAKSLRKSFGQKITDKASWSMNMVERTSGEISWRAAYRDALKQGLKGSDAITQADIIAKETLAGRGVGDKPVAFSSRALGPLTQFGLEVNNMRLQFFRDFTPKEKIKFMVAAFFLNQAYSGITGQKQLPDYIGASIDSYSDMTDSRDDSKDNGWDNTLQAAQRYAGETSKFIPGAGFIASVLFPNTSSDVFGDGSPVNRYGSLAISKVPETAVSVGQDILKGDFGGAAKDALGVIPMGNQVKRTAEGLTAVGQGYVTDGSGKVTKTVNNADPFTWAKGALFGKNALPGNDSSKKLSDKQTEMFKNIQQTNPQAAVDYFKGLIEQKLTKEHNGGYGDTGLGDTASAMSADQATTDAALKVDIASGEKVLKDGVVYTKQGNIATDYYKDAAKASKAQDESTYNAFMRGYGLIKGSEETKTGNDTFDNLLKAQDKSSATSSKATNAIGLYSNSDKYKDVPQWVKDRYYKDNGFTKKQVEYGAFAAIKPDTKLDNYYRPIAEAGDRSKLLDALTQGRVKSISGGYMATTSMITQLQKEGFLTKSEAKILNALQLKEDGSVIASAATAKEKAGSSGGSKSKSYSKDIDAFIKGQSTGIPSDVLSALTSTRSAITAPKIAARSVSMRKLSGKRSAGAAKSGKTRLG